jgi:osmotically-inducible protein OsmY
VNDTSSLTNAARDTWITTDLEATLLLDQEVASINYSVATVNQEVFVMGVAQSQAELNRVIGHAKDIAYVRRVVSNVLLKDDPARAS